jgi:hypothetical protein
LRYNQQSQDYDTADISSLIDNIFTYVKNNINFDKSEINKTQVALDISYIFTLFGNDFIPKIESIDVRNDVESLMLIYCKVLNGATKKYIIENNKDNSFSIIYINLFQIIFKLADIEHILLQSTFITNTYRNTKFLKNIFGENKLIDSIGKYIEEINNINQNIKKIKYVNDTLTKTRIEDFIINIKPNILKQYLIIEHKEKIENIENLDEKTVFSKIVEKILIIIKNNLKIKINLKLMPYENTLDSDYHMNNIKDSLPHPKMEITDYDKEVYMMEHKMGKWEKKLNAIDYNLGKINLSYKQDKYVLEEISMKTSIDEFYNEFFDIKDINNKDNEKILEAVIKKYLIGLVWVFDFYFNKNNEKDNKNTVSTWFYEYHKAPLLQQVAEYIKNKKTKIMNKEFKKYYKFVLSTKTNVPRLLYMNKLEHYLYVTPIHKHEDIPKQYDDIRKNKDFFPDLKSLVDTIITTGATKDILDCKRIPYINKCHIANKIISFDEYMKIMIVMRDSGSNNNSSNSDNIQHVINWNKKGGNVNTNNAQNIYLKEYYKNKYIATQDMKYKKYYKSIKNKLLNIN